MEQKLDLNLLAIFLEVYRLRSITLAAESLGMTQPGVSGALKRLQSQLRSELFVREGRGISPTHTAIQLAIEIEPSLETVNNAISNLQQFSSYTPRVFNIFVNESSLLHLQPKVDRDETLGNVSIHFSIAPINDDDLLNELSMQKADLAIDVSNRLGAAYCSEVIIRDELVLVVRKDHPRLKNRVITQEDYYQEQHITIRLRRSNMYAADFFTLQNLKPRKISAECDSLMSMLALVANSDCIGSCAKSVAQPYADKLGIQVLTFPFETLPVEQSMIWHTRTSHSPAHKWLREKVLSYINE